MGAADQWIGVFVVMYTITLHELGHAYAATYFGDPTPGKHGRLTFNPIVQLHPFYSVVAPIMCFIMFRVPLGFAFCPIDPSRFKRPLRDQALTALAGPTVNFAVALVCVIMLWMPFVTPPDTINQSVFFGVGIWNIFLGTFNLLPLPGLDGYSIARAFLPLSIRRPLDHFRRMGFMPLLFAFLIGPTLLGYLFPDILAAYLSILPKDIDFGARSMWDMLIHWMPGPG